MAALLPMTFWRREAWQHKENKLNKASIPRAASMTPPLSNFCCILTCLAVKIKDVSNLFWVFIFSYLAGSSLMRSGCKQNLMHLNDFLLMGLLRSIVRSAPPQWWQPGVLPPMSRCRQWHWSQCCRTPPLPVMPWTFSDWISKITCQAPFGALKSCGQHDVFSFVQAKSKIAYTFPRTSGYRVIIERFLQVLISWFHACMHSNHSNLMQKKRII